MYHIILNELYYIKFLDILLLNGYIWRASDFRNLSRITKLNTCKFLELPITISVTAVIIWYATGKLKRSEDTAEKNSVLQ